MTDPLDDALLQLQHEYLAAFPDRLEELRTDIAAFRALRPEAAAALRMHFHRLAGSGGSYGFPEISTVAREMENWMATKPAPGEAPRLDAAVDHLATLFRQAQAKLGSTVRPAGATRRATVILPASPDQDRLVAGLRAEGYDVRLAHRRDDPAGLPAGERPDLLVIGAAAGEGDPSAVASTWTAHALRPRAVVLIETLRAVDRLRAIASGVDAVIPVERMVQDLPRYARALATIGPPPSTVLLVDHDAERAAAKSEWLEQASIRVVRCALAQAVQELLEREVPDLVLLATHLPDGDAATVARIVRDDPRFRMMPIVFAGHDEVAERVTALQAGADDYLAGPTEPELLLQTVVVRAERGRRLRELLIRDPLTGLLNQVTLLAELDYAVDYGRRHGGPLSLLVFDLDRFHEVNERFGQLVGDQVLRHVANVFRSSVRASDLIGRFGGEEFAMVLRGVPAEGAAVVASKLRRVLGEQSATTAEGIIIPLHVSVGWACFPANGGSAGELVHAAVRAMRREKAER
ncbi:MAG TPA: diguanylate cyclase [Gemmatimonadales bacterium]|nr:diguanylate cyclase [Gemmatimonadales bacterium]